MKRVGTCLSAGATPEGVSGTQAAEPAHSHQSPPQTLGKDSVLPAESVSSPPVWLAQPGGHSAGGLQWLLQRPVGWWRKASGSASGVQEGCHVCFQRKASGFCDKGLMVSGLMEICVESSADDQPPHFAGPSPYLIQLGISKKAAHGKVVDVAIATEALDAIQGHLRGALG